MQIGDIVVWRWAQEVALQRGTSLAGLTELRVVDISASCKRYDVAVESLNTGRIFYHREEEVSVIRMAHHDTAHAG